MLDKKNEIDHMTCHMSNMLQIQIPKTTHKSYPKQTYAMREFSWEDVIVAPLPANHGFQFGRIIDEGITATVYEAMHEFFGVCAIKAFKPEFSYVAKDELAFLKQVQQHPYGIKVYDAWEYKSIWYIAMEKMDGTLEHFMDKDMSYEDIIDATQQIATALQDLHQKGIIHFDIKPKNIGFIHTSSGSKIYKILDYGLAEWKHVVYSNEFQCDIRNGCFEKTAKWYRSYELLLLNEDPITEKADVWSFGCLVFEMISGTPLFARLSDTDDKTYSNKIIRGALKDMVRFQKIVSPDYQQLIQIALDCLTYNVTKRPSMTDVMKRIKK
jgi:serine/threonine protein kinase